MYPLQSAKDPGERELMEGDWQQELDRAVDGLFEQMVEIRRRLHQQPELSGAEQRTSLQLYQLLSDWGFDVRMGPDGRGVVADLGQNGEATAGRVAVRADIDALPIQDEKPVQYRSQIQGVMHACGHDAHTAISYGALCAVKSLRDQRRLPWPICLRGIFQPAEEICRGAQEMIDVGAMEEVSAIVALHMDPSRKLGTVGLRVGVMTAHCDAIRITIVGRGGHAARPHETIDPIAAAAQLINALYLFIPRVTDSQDAVVVTIGKIVAGDHGNVIPERVELRGTVRTLSRDVRLGTMAHIRRLAEGVALTTGTKIELFQEVGTQAVVNDERLVGLLRRSAEEVIGPAGIEFIPRPSMGSEDFAFYLNHVPGAMMRLGCSSPRAGGSPLHSPLFDLDEQSMKIGAKILARTLIHWSETPPPAYDGSPKPSASSGN